LGLAHLHFLNLTSAPNRACGLEARAGRGKSIGGERIPAGDPPLLPQNGAGRSGARPGAPTSENPSSRRKNGLPALYHTRYRARPVQEMIWASWFFRTLPLLPGRARLEFPSPLHLLGEKWRSARELDCISRRLFLSSSRSVLD